ncbi:cell wall hydrolase/autolysin [Candidatus Koribacter versatilis Ellin345]|uniref:N-acetylmuramoyl-L-alanine amidase n=1 Tax=Koribacter versatilis (strain Ellin345) TaxID=204669 RepID=Q1INP2_KORVE|nr:N-acetylmuramoyl-L-alanine amidase [Candidatus Koribacter versatilis]ABF41508.1 cell wall hydrolase/autolysin [Candidatus Koribacter versatilis Ellin345]
MNFRTPARWFPLALAALAAVLWLSPRAQTQSERHLTVYSQSATYSVNLLPYSGQVYVGVSDVLEPLGNVEAREDGKKWKLRFTPSGGREINAEFQEGKNKGKIHNQDVQLSANFHMENGRGYIPLHNIGAMLPFFTGQQTDFRETPLRLFIGGVAISFKEQVEKGSSPKLILNFTGPVNPMVATEPGQVKLVFRRDPVVNAGAEKVQTGDANITGYSFTDAGGTAQITVNGAVPLTAAFSDGNRTITIQPAPGVQIAAEPPKTQEPAQQAAQTPTAPAPIPLGPTQPAAPAAPPQPRFVVVLDAAHGGDERGAAITDKIAEKDVNLAFARRIQHELQTRGVVATLLRSNDATINVDDRAVSANAAHPAIYVSVHAANLGNGLRIFTALMTPAGVATHTFLPWHQAQAPYLDYSSQVAGSISAELSNRQIPVTALPAPLRPMRNIAAPAIAIELAPPDDEVTNINSPEYQNNVAAAVANGIAAMKPKLLGAR